MTRVSALKISLGIVIQLTCFVSVFSNDKKLDSVTIARVENQIRMAVRFMDRGYPAKALPLWDSVVATMPDRIPYQYERVVTLTMMERFQEALDNLTRFYQHPDLLDRGYQMMGNIYGFLDSAEKSIELYNAGFQQFPTSGRLHFELGNVAYVQSRYSEAIQWWMNGIRNEPHFATNYYWIAKLSAISSNKLWTLIFGETFLNMERHSSRTREMSKLLFETWNAGIFLGDSVDPIRYCSDSLLGLPGPDGPSSMAFPMAFEFTLANVLASFTPSVGIKTRLSIEEWVKVRSDFLKEWKRQGNHERFPNTLFDWLFAVNDAGYLSEYLHFMFSYGDTDEMTIYYKQNSERYDNFLAWFTTNTISIDSTSLFGMQ